MLEKESRRKEAEVSHAESQMVDVAELTKTDLREKVAAATVPASGHDLQEEDFVVMTLLFAPVDEEHEDELLKFNEDTLIAALQKELRMSHNHIPSVTSLRSEQREVDVRLSKPAATSLWTKTRDTTLTDQAPKFIAIIASNGDRVNRDGTVVPNSEKEDDNGGSIDSMFEEMAAEEKRKEEALEKRRRLEKAEEERMKEVQAQLKAQHEEHKAIKEAKKEKVRQEQQKQAAIMIQSLVRGKLAKLQLARKAELAEMEGVYELATAKGQALVRRFLTRMWYVVTLSFAYAMVLIFICFTSLHMFHILQNFVYYFALLQVPSHSPANA